MITTLFQYQMVSRDLNRTLETTAKDPQVKRETEYYLKNIGNIKTIDDLLKDTRIFKYAMKAFGLEDMDYAKAFMKKALKEGVDDSRSFANKLSDKRYAQFVTAFDFKVYEELTTTRPEVKQPVVDAYVRQTLEVNSGNQNEAVRLALYFNRKSSSIKGPFDILSDRALTKVVYTSLGLPENFAMANIDKQADFLKQRLNFDDFKDPAKLDTFLRRFATMWDFQNGTPATSSIATLIMAGPGASASISEGLLSQIQSLRLGGR
ncbi:Protein of uncharacterised function (DUF1217) [Pannonibacter phragmitetus]|uniref:Protein of uncharacterized function (DUF1217) n=2 Tax=Pannonibacter phragmitetus TaxID=121719 RepID=A0A378ZRW6_9HYPH|nr:Protein of uncharacterised function (DUF1217) [Pannonibacter phragmitetus]